jgi:hypothetical protein
MVLLDARYNDLPVRQHSQVIDETVAGARGDYDAVRSKPLVQRAIRQVADE